MSFAISQNIPETIITPINAAATGCNEIFLQKPYKNP
jgi:hypothetical protein